MEAPDFFVEDLLDLSNGGDEMTTTDTFFDSATGHSAESSAITAVDSSNSSAVSFPFDSHFSSSLSLPYDEMAELEWLSNFVEESFSNETFHKLQLNPQIHPDPIPSPNPSPNPASSVPAKARSKRSRVAPCDWSTRLLMVSPPTPSPASSSSSSATTSAHKKAPSKRRDVTDNSSHDGEVRRCFHCATEKTPQWRTGPMGPKTLCNACGVRYKSGRLVAEYRPAASPTFVSTKHSNSHRKVVELRRQKEVQRHQQQQQFIHHHHQQQSMMMAAGVSNGGDDFLIHHHHQMGHDYRQII